MAPFDKTSYQRTLMRKRRAEEKSQELIKKIEEHIRILNSISEECISIIAKFSIILNSKLSDAEVRKALKDIPISPELSGVVQFEIRRQEKEKHE